MGVCGGARGMGIEAVLVLLLLILGFAYSFDFSTTMATRYQPLLGRGWSELYIFLCSYAPSGLLVLFFARLGSGPRGSPVVRSS